MGDPTFHAVCEAAAVAWDIPALAVGTSVGGEIETIMFSSFERCDLYNLKAKDTNFRSCKFKGSDFHRQASAPWCSRGC